MISTYNPVTQTNTLSAGALSVEVLLLNILIELRVMNNITLDKQRGLAEQTLTQYRADVVSTTGNLGT